MSNPRKFTEDYCCEKLKNLVSLWHANWFQVTFFCAVSIHCYPRWRWAKVRNTISLIFQFIFVYLSGSDYPEFAVFAFSASCITDLKTFKISGRFHASHPHPNVHIQEDFCFFLFLCETKKIVQKFICFIMLIRPWLVCVCVCHYFRYFRFGARLDARLYANGWRLGAHRENAGAMGWNAYRIRAASGQVIMSFTLICLGLWYALGLSRNSRCIRTGHFCFISKSPCLSLIADRQTDRYNIHMYLHYIHV